LTWHIDALQWTSVTGVNVLQFASGQQGAHANGDWQEVGKEGPPDPEKKKKKNRKQRYKENLVTLPMRRGWMKLACPM
jgi:hypothetical protein